jgi:hypothetical protein
LVDLVVPELQRRGLFRTEYDGTTLSDHFGLDRAAWKRGTRLRFDDRCVIIQNLTSSLTTLSFATQRRDPW